MRFRSIKHWKDKENCRGLIFFAQRLEELTFEYSLDSFKAPTTNAPFLIEEAIDQIEKQSHFDLNLNSAYCILDEMELRLRKNKVVKSLISLDLDSYLDYNRQNAGEITRKLKVLKREIEPNIYCLRTMELLRIAISEVAKKEIDFLARELVSTLVNLGMSSSYINRKCVEYFFGRKIEVDGIGSISGFFHEIFPHAHNFTFLFKISGESSVIKRENIELFGMEILDSPPEKFLGDVGRLNFGVDGSQKYLFMQNIYSLDISSAMRMAEENPSARSI
ncbi:hypothetical protein B5K11_13815 [Rhizobium leguminosarum bv. trifolii]|uniref:hypothetical protein n=1 Tax=Rhizobium leguminosarum TaxID=384 RepID=UPI000E2F7C1D|nr:hypothetical protein [Rhizobium leguminosarum]RFB93594.1 hypothetical protein B5K11_13815 [Rhizobium leguminosarum bv. trifolii]